MVRNDHDNKNLFNKYAPPPTPPPPPHFFLYHEKTFEILIRAVDLKSERFLYFLQACVVMGALFFGGFDGVN